MIRITENTRMRLTIKSASFRLTSGKQLIVKPAGD
jgi:hypothetical protein